MAAVEYKIEEVLDYRVTKDEKQYLIKWHGHPTSENSWVSLMHLPTNVPALYKERLERQKEPDRQNVVALLRHSGLQLLRNELRADFKATCEDLESKFATAREKFDLLSDAQRTNIECRALAALSLMKMGFFNQASLRLVECLKMQPNDYVTQTLLAECYLKTSYPAFASKQVDAALKIRPDYLSALWLRFLLVQHGGDPIEVRGASTPLLNTKYDAVARGAIAYLDRIAPRSANR